MVSSKSLEVILQGYPKYESFSTRIDLAANWIYSILMDYKKEENINIISHLADADGFGAQIVFDKGLNRILSFLGNVTKKVQSERIMGFSKDKKSVENLSNLREILGEGKYIITDLATLNPQEANKVLRDLLFIDHHPLKEGFDERFVVVNPHQEGINGSSELSASMVSTFVINRVYEMIEGDFGKDKKVKSGLNKLREELDYISLFGLAGSKADMQEDTGLNKAMYEYLQGRGLIKWVDCPFYGYSTKDAMKVWGQANPMFNFKYMVVDAKYLNKAFARTFPNISGDRERLANSLYQDFRWAFSREEEGLGINLHYLNDLSDEKIGELNSQVEMLVGEKVVEISYEDGKRSLVVGGSFKESVFEVTDDVHKMESRVNIAQNLISDWGYEPEMPLSMQRGLSEKLKGMFADSFIAFSEREDLDYSLSLLKKGQYVSRLEKELVKDSIAEIANMMTSMSKLECGDIFMGAIDEVLDGVHDEGIKVGKSKISQVYEMHKKYKKYLYQSMRSLEDKLLTRDGLVVLGEDSYFMNVDFLKQCFEGDIELSKMNGVCGGIACNTKLLPSGKGILYTGTTFKGMYDERETQLVKISGRATQLPRYEGVKINALMNVYGGGGHNNAAACVIPLERLGDFIESASKFDLYKG